MDAPTANRTSPEPSPGDAGEPHRGEGKVQAVDTGKQTIKAFIDAVWVGGDLDALDRFWTDSCINHAAPAGQDVGLAALRSYHESFATSFAAFSDSSIQVFQQVVEDDRVVTHLVTSGRHVGEFAGTPATGKQVALTTIRIDRLEDGRIAEHWSVADISGLLQQLHS